METKPYVLSRGNARRGRNGGETVRAHAKKGGLTKADGVDTWLVDTLTDIMHWATQKNVDFDDALRIARDHLDTEAKGEE